MNNKYRSGERKEEIKRDANHSLQQRQVQTPSDSMLKIEHVEDKNLKRDDKDDDEMSVAEQD